MTYLSVGDMAQSYLMQRHNVQIKSTMTRLTEELTTGVQKDLGAAVKGDFSALAAIDLSLARIGSFSQVTTETELFADTQQNALAVLQDQADSVGATLVSAAATTQDEMIRSVTGDAAQRFDSIIAALNVSVAGRYVFSGTATDTPPLASSDDILGALAVTIAGLGTAQDIASAVSDWFNAPAGGGGYIDVAYQGSSTTLAPQQLSSTDTVELATTALDPDVRELLQGFAMAALVGRNLVPSDPELRAQLSRTAGEQILTSAGPLTATRAAIGTAQEAIATAQARNTSESAALELSRGQIIGVDEYDTATALEALQSQLETLYTLTARLSGLSLTDYLR